MCGTGTGAGPAPGVVAALAAAIGQLRGGGFGVLLRHGVQTVHAVAWRGEGGGGDLDGEQEGDPQCDVAVDGAGGPGSEGSDSRGRGLTYVQARYVLHSLPPLPPPLLTW